MISKDYLSGFIDGEGSFIVRFKKDGRYVSKMQVEPHINITQKDKCILEKIQKDFEMGKMYYHKRDNIWHLNITKLNDLLKLMKTIKDRLYVKKNKAERFYKCLLAIKKKQHLTKEGVESIFNLWITPETDDKPG